MVQSSSISITPAKHADRHVVGGSDPLVNPLLLHASRHNAGGADAVYALFHTMNDVTGSRVSNTIYQNTTDNSMLVTVTGRHSSGGIEINAYIGAVTPPTTLVGSGNNQVTYKCGVSFIVPAGFYYKVVENADSNRSWVEIT